MSKGVIEQPFAQTNIFSDWKTIHWLSESLVSLGIMGTKLKRILKPLKLYSAVMVKLVSGAPQLVPHDAKGPESPGQLYVGSLLFFQSAVCLKYHFSNSILTTFRKNNSFHELFLGSPQQYEYFYNFQQTLRFTRLL